MTRMIRGGQNVYTTTIIYFRAGCIHTDCRARPFSLPILKRLKFGQSIRKEGPESHQVKTGTPTMGGLTYLIPILVLALISLLFVDDVYKMLVLIIVTVGFGLIGFIDDYIIVVKKDNAGLTSKQKFLAQIAVSVIVYFILTFAIPDISSA